MEIALSLGEHLKPFPFIETKTKLSRSKDIGFGMEIRDETRLPSDPTLKLRFPAWFTHNHGDGRGLDVNRSPLEEAEESEEGASVSSPNSTVSSFQMEISSCLINGRNRGKRDLKGFEGEKASDDDEFHGSTRKKLRLSKQQSASLEDCFKEHNTLNPKQKLALAKQ